MVAQLVAMRRLGLDILSSGVTKKTRLDCGGSIDPLPTGEQDNILLFCSILLTISYARLLLSFRFKNTMFSTIKWVALFIEAALTTSTVAICCRILFGNLQNECTAQMRQLFKALPTYPCPYSFRYLIEFDQTLGYPGEGYRWQKAKTKRQKRRAKRKWSQQQPNLRIATWNPRSLTRERFNYCRSLNYDILGLTELWRTQEKYLNETKRWTCSAIHKDKNGNIKNQGDPAAGAGILLSPRMEKKVLSCL